MRKSNGNLAANGTLYWYMTPGVVAETDLAGTLKSEYVFFDGERVARRDGATGTGGVFYYFSDHLKTASVITDSAGVIKAESDYYPWGGELQFVNNDSNDYKFTGKKRDTETGLDYFGARYYSNGLGRFLNADWAAKATAVPYAEFGDPQTLNLYSYVRNTPLAKFDLDGHFGQQQSCGTGSSSVCGDIPKNTMGAPTDSSSKVTTDTHGEIQCSGSCPSATAIKAGGDAAANTAEFGVTLYAGPVTVSVTPSGANVNAQVIPSVGATVDLTIPKPDDSKGPTASVSTGTKAVGASANIQDGKVTSVTGSAGFVVGPKAAEKIPEGENVSASFGKVIDTIKNIYHSAAQSPQPGEFENLSD